jgi:hypothetical protein
VDRRRAQLVGTDSEQGFANTGVKIVNPRALDRSRAARKIVMLIEVTW